MRDENLGPDPTSQALLRLIPKFGGVVAQWRQDMFEREQRRVERLGEAVAEDIDLVALLEQLQSDEVLSDMFRASVEAAVKTGSGLKIRLLGKALASGALAKDDAAVDEAGQLLRIAAELDPVDLRALLVIDAKGRGYWDPRRLLQREMGASKAIVDPILARLQRLGLVDIQRAATVNDPGDEEDDSVNIEEEWLLTRAASALLTLLDPASESG